MSTKLFLQAVSLMSAELKDMVRALILIERNQTQLRPRKKLFEQAAAANFNQANSGYRPPMVSNQIRPPGFPPVQILMQTTKTNFNRGNKFNQKVETISSKASTSGSGTLPGNTVRNPIGRFKSFEISFTMLDVMPKFASTLKSLIGTTEKLSELARTPLNENCSAPILVARLISCLILYGNVSYLTEFDPDLHELELADRSITEPIGIAEDGLCKLWESSQFPADFVVVILNQTPSPLNFSGMFLKTKVHALIEFIKGIVPRTIKFKSGLEVDRAKVEVKAKLPHPTSVKGVRSFLGTQDFPDCEDSRACSIPQEFHILSFILGIQERGLGGVKLCKGIPSFKKLTDYNDEDVSKKVYSSYLVLLKSSTRS
ncbi:hypothetical protein Tco_0557040 [Tanacetum coccineum]